ncbi:MAG: uncharacterized protein KVP18_004749 [Porospora cf. gigantea A]|uniref:uncharacterized protein n=1 Tax=Porospora cf. gigantea A TaxID=2853593 RepID=UPI00355AC921|nr:MAG: hypothetical protein KVP18_004749 [Porospora cf. gigantea A]
MAKQFDIILWGATGYTGGLALKYLFNRYGTTVKFAVAGRSVEKLEALMSELQVSVKVPLLEASLEDEASLRKVAASCKAIIACVGPFRLYGEPLMKACIAEQTHYVDITGETDWIKKMDQKYSEQAKSQGVTLMPFCAFEAASTEMGLIQLFNEAENIEHGAALSEGKVTQTFQTSGGAFFSSGTMKTIASIVAAGDVEGSPRLSPFELAGVAPNEYARKNNSTCAFFLPRWDDIQERYLIPHALLPGLVNYSHWTNRRNAFVYGEQLILSLGVPVANVFVAYFLTFCLIVVGIAMQIVARVPALLKQVLKVADSAPAPDASTTVTTSGILSTRNGPRKLRTSYRFMGDAYQFSGMFVVEAALRLARSDPAQTGVCSIREATGSDLWDMLKTHPRVVCNSDTPL